VPAVAQRAQGLDRQDLAFDLAPFGRHLEPLPNLRTKVVGHDPFGQQVALRQRTPEPLRRVGELAFDDKRAGFGGRGGQLSILASRSSSLSNRSSQNARICPVQSSSGA